jgi:uncharacterized protein (DUF2235 family)
MTAIAIFCDGTWNNKDRTDKPTSVARIFQALEAQRNAGDRSIAPYYIEGVGADNEQQSLGKTIDRWRGGALGRGLTLNIREGYAHLCDTYKAGDKIYIFGFSRGAYTARSLAGLIRACGLVRDPDHINTALARYRNNDRATKPNTVDTQKFRIEKSPDFHTNSSERTWRIQNGHPPGAPITIAYMGIFDTVGANGIPGILGQLGLIPGGHGFHDLELSSMVQSGRHALGLDERRRLYRHTEWSNLEKLNRQTGMDARGGARYRQEWFPGDHGMIGGSGAQRQISNSVMAWILEGAEVAGLKVRLPAAVHAKSDDHKGPLSNSDASDGWGKGWRSGPDRTALADINDVSLKRVRDVTDYRPKSLKLLDASGWEAMVNQELSTRIV